MTWTGPIHHATVEQTQSGKYFVVLNVDLEPEPLPETEKKVGLDVGIRNFCTDSRGNITVNPKFLEGSEEKLAKEMRRFSRMKPGSKNREKQRRKAARAYERIVNQRNDFLHKAFNLYPGADFSLCWNIKLHGTEGQSSGCQRSTRAARHAMNADIGTEK